MARRVRRAPVIALLGLLGGCAGFHPLVMDEVAAGHASRIHGVRIAHESPGHLDLEVDYTYDGAVGTCAFAGATSRCSGADACRDAPPAPWAYTPAPLEPGRHVAHVLVSMNGDAPRMYASDELHIDLYEGGKSEFATATFAYPKLWRRERASPRWVGDWAWCKAPSARTCD